MARTYVPILTTLKNGLCYGLIHLRVTENTVFGDQTINRYFGMNNLGSLGLNFMNNVRQTAKPLFNYVVKAKLSTSKFF